MECRQLEEKPFFVIDTGKMRVQRTGSKQRQVFFVYVPKVVVQTLRLKKGDVLEWWLSEDGMLKLRKTNGWL